MPQSETLKPGDVSQVLRQSRVRNLWRRYVQMEEKKRPFSGQMGLSGGGSVVEEMNARIRLRLPDRAQAQHLLGCVCARLCEQLEPKALTTRYTADKPACVGESFPAAAAPSPSPRLPHVCLLVRHSGAWCRYTGACLNQRGSFLSFWLLLILSVPCQVLPRLMSRQTTRVLVLQRILLLVV